LKVCVIIALISVAAVRAVSPSALAAPAGTPVVGAPPAAAPAGPPGALPPDPPDVVLVPGVCEGAEDGVELPPMDDLPDPGWLDSLKINPDEAS